MGVAAEASGAIRASTGCGSAAGWQAERTTAAAAETTRIFMRLIPRKGGEGQGLFLATSTSNRFGVPALPAQASGAFILEYAHARHSPRLAMVIVRDSGFWTTKGAGVGF
jgi:hypothetical protein